MRDTTPAAAAARAQAQRQLGGPGRLRLAFEMSVLAREVTLAGLRGLAILLPAPEFYMHEGAALEAYDREGQFNVVDLATGWKADLIMRRSRAFSRIEFDRRTVVELEGCASPSPRRRTSCWRSCNWPSWARARARSKVKVGAGVTTGGPRAGPGQLSS